MIGGVSSSRVSASRPRASNRRQRANTRSRCAMTAITSSSTAVTVAQFKLSGPPRVRGKRHAVRVEGLRINNNRGDVIADHGGAVLRLRNNSNRSMLRDKSTKQMIAVKVTSLKTGHQVRDNR